MTSQISLVVALIACASALGAEATRSAASAFGRQAAVASPYFGQPVPGLSPELFAPGVVSTDAIELNGVFSPDLKELFFTRQVDGIATMFHSTAEGGTWSAPRELLLFPGETRAVAVDMAVSPDGRELYFMGITSHRHSTARPNPDIWRSRRIDGKWATAELMPAPISTDANEVYPVIVADGSLYYTSNRQGGMGRNSLYRAQRLPNGDFAAPVLVPPPVNSEHGVGDFYVSPDERYMVLALGKPPSVGRGDLFVSYRGRTGEWGEPVHLGGTVNTSDHEYCPMVTPDGKYLFFSRRQGAQAAGTGDVYWVDAKILEPFKPSAAFAPESRE